MGTVSPLVLLVTVSSLLFHLLDKCSAVKLHFGCSLLEARLVRKLFLAKGVVFCISCMHPILRFQTSELGSNEPPRAMPQSEQNRLGELEKSWRNPPAITAICKKMKSSSKSQRLKKKHRKPHGTSQILSRNGNISHQQHSPHNHRVKEPIYIYINTINKPPANYQSGYFTDSSLPTWKGLLTELFFELWRDMKPLTSRPNGRRAELGNPWRMATVKRWRMALRWPSITVILAKLEIQKGKQNNGKHHKQWVNFSVSMHINIHD